MDVYSGSHARIVSPAGQALSVLVVCLLGMLLLLCSPARGQAVHASRAGNVGVADAPAPVNLSMNQVASVESPEYLAVVHPAPLSGAGAFVLPALGREITIQLQDVPLEHALKRIAAEAEINIAYLRETVSAVGKTVTLDLEAVTARAALRMVLDGTELRLMRSRSGQLILANRPEVVSLGPERLPVQVPTAPKLRPLVGTITGTVTDSTTGEPLPGVNVVIAGTQQGAATDGQGQYTIPNVEAGTYDLLASFVGYTTKRVEDVEVRDGEETQVDIVLQPSTFALENVVVTALGVERATRSLTYATQEVNTANIAEARSLNVVNSLSGKVAGLSISQAGTGVGGSSRVLLRGNRSLTGNSQPLYVVDGVSIRGDLSTLNPDVIESINVLKGPNAAALYGSEAQNGAIVITTKRAEAGVINATFSTNFMFRQPMIFREYQNVYGQGSGGEYSPTSEFNWGPRMEGQMVDHWSPAPDRADAQYAFEPQPGNVRDAFQVGYNSSTNVTASIGGDVAQTLFSYSFTDARGIVPNNVLQRHNIQLRVTSQLTDRLSLDGKIAYMQEQIDNQLPTGENFANPIRHIYRLPRNISTRAAERFEYRLPNGEFRQHFWNPGSNGGANPYWTMNRNLDLNKSRRVLALASLTYDVTENLSLMARGSYDGASASSETKLYNDTYVIANNGEYSLSKSDASLLNIDALLSYSRDISDDWYLDVNVGGNIKKERNSGLNANTGQALTVPNFFAISNTQNVIATENVGAPRDVYSLYGFAQIGWRNAVYLDVTGRNDWSSTLPADSRSYFYPSVGLSVILSDLIPAMPEFISYAKVRGSWAKVGNSAPPFRTVRTAALLPGGNNGFLQLSSVLPNKDLLPEETVSREIGLDLRFFNNRLGLNVTAYKTNTRNQLFTVALPVGSGASSFFTNGGNVENKGIEVLLSATPIQTPDFNWDITTNFSTNRNTVVEISEEQPILTITSGFLRAFRIEEGEPFGQVYSRGFVRDEQGRVVVDSTGIPLITDGLTVPVANFTPDWKGGIWNSFTYKNFDFSFLIEHRQGGSIVSFTDAILYADGLLKPTLAGRGEERLAFGEGVFADETTVVQVGVDGEGNPMYEPYTADVDPESLWRNLGGRNAPVGEAFVESGTNTRLREVVLGYTLPQSVFAGTPISRFRISMVGRNLFFFYRASDSIDPDILVGTGAAAEGFESFAPPSTRTFGANIQVTF